LQTVFSHIIQKRFSKVNEDVATDALAFIIKSSESARNGILKLLRGIVADLPELRFRTQQTKGSIRPDMCGFDSGKPRVFIENKFWAGLTENQPVSYLKQLAEYTQPTVLLVVVPAAREQTLWRELMHRLKDAEITVSDTSTAAGIVQSVTTEIGPVLALTSWSRLLSVLELETAEDQEARSNLVQLRSLCDAADSQAFVPITPVVATDQHMPAFILQMGRIVKMSVDLGVTEGLLNTKGLLPQASWHRIGQYIRFDKEDVGAWFGINFTLWRQLGGTPLWLVFSPGEFCRGPEVYALLEPWAVRNNIVITVNNGNTVIGLDLLVGEDRDNVIRFIVDRLRDIAHNLSALTNQNESKSD
jgi:hypothetical protein